jgi:hypothetical protein
MSPVSAATIYAGSLLGFYSRNINKEINTMLNTGKKWLLGAMLLAGSTVSWADGFAYGPVQAIALGAYGINGVFVDIDDDSDPMSDYSIECGAGILTYAIAQDVDQAKMYQSYIQQAQASNRSISVHYHVVDDYMGNPSLDGVCEMFLMSD